MKFQADRIINPATVFRDQEYLVNRGLIDGLNTGSG
jgi:hypothetical protein